MDRLRSLISVMALRIIKPSLVWIGLSPISTGT